MLTVIITVVAVKVADLVSSDAYQVMKRLVAAGLAKLKRRRKLNKPDGDTGDKSK